MNHPLVSVVIPTYNRAHMVVRAIQSVLQQTYREFEVLVVDDASDDNTSEAVKNLKDSRIRYLRHEKNKGGSAARNTGIQAARGEYIAFLDSDDEWLPEKLDKQVKVLNSSGDETGFVYNGFVAVSGKTGKILYRLVTRKVANIFKRPLEANGSSLLVRKQCFKHVGLFDETLASCQDWDLAIRLCGHYDFDFIPEALTKYYFHGAQLSASLERKIQGRESLIRKHHKDFLKYPSILADHYSRLAILNVLKGDKAKARRFFMMSIAARPLQAFAYRHFLYLSLFPGYYSRVLDKKHIDPEGMQFFW